MQVLKFLLDFFTKKSRVQGGALPLPAQGQKQMDSFRNCKSKKRPSPASSMLRDGPSSIQKIFSCILPSGACLVAAIPIVGISFPSVRTLPLPYSSVCPSAKRQQTRPFSTIGAVGSVYPASRSDWKKKCSVTIGLTPFCFVFPNGADKQLILIRFRHPLCSVCCYYNTTGAPQSQWFELPKILLYFRIIRQYPAVLISDIMILNRGILGYSDFLDSVSQPSAEGLTKQRFSNRLLTSGPHALKMEDREAFKNLFHI